MTNITTNSEAATIALGKKYAVNLNPGDVLGLVGELGAGKTQFAKGLAKGLGIKDNITSPTFVLLKKYKNLVHIDCYRLSDPTELEELGFQEFIDNGNIVVVEWADKIKSIMPSETKWVKFKVGSKENERVITL
jgi:tRNA threonylcarbamoyladenosine biosynthesis protein TsaE